MIPREQERLLKQMAGWFPVLSVTGPRQSGKSTLVRAAFPDYEYVNLENPQTRTAAAEDPVGFIRSRSGRLIIDEAQYVPELFSMIQAASDERNQPGQYVLSGSQNFLMLKHISQSLAGRVGLLKLLPLSYREASGALGSAGSESLASGLSADDFMFKGGYPRLYASVDSAGEPLPAQLFYSNYLSTYVERDVADYLDVRNLAGFRKFLRLCALRTGSLMNYSLLARDADVDARTAKAWLSILESSYLAFTIEPYFANAGKRMVKTPKMYWYDTGLLCYLLGISSLRQLLLSPYLGAVFENLMVAERLKSYLNRGKEPQLYFYRDAEQTEVDLLDYSNPEEPMLVEMKSGQTYRDSWAQGLNRVGELLGVNKSGRFIVSRVEDSFTARQAQVLTAADWLLSEV
ncbi:hypothetical protein KIM372_14270 [Bombiscardovia nodaiensis]|uniref:ATPase AAA n=1 Tax=Bombiscardovia nodaiensis TaxID=2932181 RepID=A0ABM8B9F0_9BIFI|nr:hypothetical protein KIM372_14270 [Bombiscardovia nodaiensis]